MKRVVITSSFAAITHAPNHPKLYDESVWNPVTYEEATKDNKFTTYRGSKVCHRSTLEEGEILTMIDIRRKSSMGIRGEGEAKL